jgi:hypothetical protein
VIALALLLPLLAACSQGRAVGQDEYGDDSRRSRVAGRLGGTDGIIVIGVDRNRQAQAAAQEGAGLGVNAFLWRATLDTLGFMPLASADPFGGVIITDWYAPPAAQGERFKATAYVLGRQLRSDGISIQVFRQVQDRNGAWVDAPVSAGTASELEDKVLARARELRTQSAAR